MSNARERAYLERMSAPVVAYLIDHAYVVDDGGILNVKNYHWREGAIIASRTLNGAAQVPIPRVGHHGERIRERL